MQATQHRHPAKRDATSDTLAILGMFAVGGAGTAVAMLLAARLLMDLPPMLAAAITFSLIVFFLACGAALLLGTNPRPAARQPPVLVFRDLCRRRPMRARPADSSQRSERAAKC